MQGAWIARLNSNWHGGRWHGVCKAEYERASAPEERYGRAYVTTNDAMKYFNVPIFDEYISGGSPAQWYSSDEFLSLLGGADVLEIQAATSMVSGTSPTLTIDTQQSADGSNFAPHTSMASVPISNNGIYCAGTTTAARPLRLVRIRISLGGTAPRCRLKITATGRAT